MEAAAKAVAGRGERTKRGKFKPQITEAILSAIRAGQTDRTACQMAGIHFSVLYDWVNEGREATSGRYREFFLAYEKARAESEVPIVTVVRRSIVGGVYRLPMFDEYGERIMREDGTPKFRTVTLLPDGNLGLRLLAIRNPHDWGGREMPPPTEERSDYAPGEVINLLREACEFLVAAGVDLPKDIVLPPSQFKPVPNQPALEHANGAHQNGAGVRNGKRDPDNQDPPF